MSVLRKTKRRVESLIAWVLAIAVVGLLALGLFYVVQVI